MAKKGGTVKRFLLILILLSLALIVFILFGGADLLKSAGRKIEGAGKEAETLKQKVEDQAATIEKKVEKVKESVSTGEKK
jgi:F0F1-type ATP synthase membrane subunit b/b'